MKVGGQSPTRRRPSSERWFSSIGTRLSSSPDYELAVGTRASRPGSGGGAAKCEGAAPPLSEGSNQRQGLSLFERC